MYNVEIRENKLEKDFNVTITYLYDEYEELNVNNFDYEIKFNVFENKEVELIDKINKFTENQYLDFRQVIQYLKNKYFDLNDNCSIQISLNCDDFQKINYLEIVLFKDLINNNNHYVGMEIIDFCTIFTDSLNYYLDDFSFNYSHDKDYYFDDSNLIYPVEIIFKKIDNFISKHKK